MVLSDFLSWVPENFINPHENILISLNMLEIVKEGYNNIHVPEIEKYMIQTRSATQPSRVKMPEVHGTDKDVNPNLIPQKQAVKQASKPCESHAPRE